MDWIPRKFAEKEVEGAFAEFYVLRHLSLVQFSLIAAGATFYMFYLYDQIIDKQNLLLTKYIRAAMLVAFWAAALSTLYDIGKRNLEAICNLLAILAILSLCVIFSIQKNGFTYSAAGFIIIIFFGCALFYVRIRNFLIFLSISLISYLLCQIAFGNTDVAIFSVNAIYAVGAVILAYLALLYKERSARAEFFLQRELCVEKAKVETLLYNVLPQSVAERLRQGLTIADAYADASVIFVDLVGSSRLARTLSPRHFLKVLNDVFSLADRCAEQTGVEKVKTIGDAYLAVAGAAQHGDPQAAILFARAVIQGIEGIANEQGLTLCVRVGIHTGPVIGGVIGETRMAYDYWGDTMNVAARVQGAAEPGGLTVSEQTYFATKDSQAYSAPRIMTLKGIGEMKLYDAVW